MTWRPAILVILISNNPELCPTKHSEMLLIKLVASLLLIGYSWDHNKHSGMLIEDPILKSEKFCPEKCFFKYFFSKKDKMIDRKRRRKIYTTLGVLIRVLPK